MPLLDRAAQLKQEVSLWRRHLHSKPELLYDVHETAAFVEQKLREFGCDEVVTGIGRTGVVGVIKGKKGAGQAIGLRADMDALPLTETGTPEWVSQNPGKAHSCGHDGHTSMLLGAAKILCETRDFYGEVIVIFQPAEEGGAGGLAMVKDGMMERFNIVEVYGMHNMPGIQVGELAVCKGPIMAATDEFTITINGKGGHAAQPHRNIDPIVIGSQLVTALQSIVSRGSNPLDSLVISVTKFNAGEAYNIIPEKAVLAGTVRSLTKHNRAFAEQRMRAHCEAFGLLNNIKIDLDFKNNYPVTFNHSGQTEIAADVADKVSINGPITREVEPMMGGEDFSYMLEARPGCYIFLGNGESANLHHPAYDFNDDALPYGMSYWVELAQYRLKDAQLAPAEKIAA